MTKKSMVLCLICLILINICCLPAVSEAEEAAQGIGILEILGICSPEILEKETITRGEFAQIAINFQNSGSFSALSDTKFSDVPKTHENSGAIAALTDLGYINGDENGKFNPNEPILVSHAVKIMVEILGYGFYTDGIPDYLFQAQSLGLLAGVNTNGSLSGEACVQLLANALEAKTLVPSKIGSQVELAKEKAIEAFYDLNRVSGVVQAIGDLSLTGAYGNIGDSAVVDGVTYDNEYDELRTLLGYQVSLYVRNTDQTIIYAQPRKNSSVTVIDKDIVKSDCSMKTLAVLDENGREIYYDFDDEVDVIYNGNGYYAYTLEDILPEYGSVTMIDNDNDGEYEVVRVENYLTAAVNSADFENYRILDLYGRTYPEMKDVKELYITKNGKKALFSDMFQGDVAGIGMDKDGKYANVVISNQKANGIVQTVSEKEITIGNETYEFAPSFTNLVESVRPALRPGDKINATLDIYGRIAYVKKNSDRLEYGYLINVEKKSVYGYEIKLLTEAGSVEIYPVADDAKIDDKAKVDEENLIKYFSETSKIISPTLIKYRLNAEGEISRLYSESSGLFVRDFDYKKRSEAGGARVFSDDGDFVYDMSTVIFNVPDPDYVEECEDSEYTSPKNVTSYVDYNTSEVAAFDVNEFGVAGAVVKRSTVFRSRTMTADEKRVLPILVVTEIRESVNPKGDDIKMVCGYDRSGKQTYAVREENYSLLSDVEPGDAIICLVDGITNYLVDLYMVNKRSNTTYNIQKDKVGSGNIAYYEVVFGKVYNRYGDILKTSYITSPSRPMDYKLFPASGCVVMVVNSKNKVRYGTLSEVGIGSTVLIRASASAVWEIILYND